MRIDRLDLIAYGPFTDRSLDFSEGSSGLHLIYGDNEAGKSTSLRALIAWLFGIPARTADNFLHPHPRLRVGGKLKLQDGRELEFVRRKGTKDTLLIPGTDTPLDDSRLLPFLPGGMDEALFTKLYGIDHGRLLAGGRELLSQSGNLGQALFSAAVGTVELREILAGLKDSAEDLFKPRASTKLINQAITSFKEAQNRIKESTLSVAEWKSLQDDLADILSDITQVENSIRDRSRKKSRLERLARVRGVLADRRSLIAQIGTMGDVLLLPEGFDDELRTAVESLRSSLEAKEKGEAKLERLKEEAASQDTSSELLENEEAISGMYRELGAVEKMVEDRPKRDSERRMLLDEAGALLKAVRPDIGLDASDRLRPLLNNKKWILDLGRRHSLLEQKKEDSEVSLRDLEAKWETVHKELGQRPQGNMELEDLKAAITEARKAGDLEQRLSDAQDRVSEKKANCEGVFARLGRFSGTSVMLTKTAMPVPETLDAFERRCDETADKIKDAERRRKELEEERAQADQALKTLLLKSDVPAIAELEESRAVRNTGWNLIKRKYIELADIEQDVAEFVPDSDLPTFYEQKVSDADRVADRLRSEADQVVKRAELEAKIETLDIRLKSIAEETQRAVKENNACQKEWCAVWESLCVNPGTPREMKQWMLRAGNLVDDFRSAEAASGEAEKLLNECETLKETLSRHISKFDGSIHLMETGLEARIHICEQHVEREEAVLERKRQLELSLDETGNRLKRIHEELQSIETDRSAWGQEWVRAVDGLSPDAGIHPEQAAGAFEKLEMVFEKLDESEKLGKRISGMDRVSADFEKMVFEFADRIGFNRQGLEASTVVAQLNRDLKKASEARASLERIEAQLKELMEEISNAGITIRAALEQLDALRNQAGVREDSELEAAGERSRNKRELQNRLHTLEEELSRNGDGLSIEKLEKEAGESDIDSIEDELGRVSSELRELYEKRDELRDRRRTLHDEINAKDGSAAAAEASEESEQQLAIMVSGIEQYLRLRIAALMLEQRIEDYRKNNQAPVLARAGEIFARLTMGSYVNLRDELDDDRNPVLLGVRPNDEEVFIEGMSDGSRDQLYLALRLATLEQHLVRGEPLPFVVDDILIGFDDNRTGTCLEILAELAAKTQVLIFTHHQRVLELAAALKTDAGIYSHELGS